MQNNTLTSQVGRLELKVQDLSEMLRKQEEELLSAHTQQGELQAMIQELLKELHSSQGQLAENNSCLQERDKLWDNLRRPRPQRKAPIHPDAWGRPTTLAIIKGKFRQVSQRLLVDTGTSVSLLCLERDPIVNRIPIQDTKVLEGYAGGNTTISFTIPVTYKIKNVVTEITFGIQRLGGQGILGIDLMRQLRVIVDLPNSQLFQAADCDQYGVTEASHRVSALKAPEGIEKPQWEADVSAIAQKHSGVFASNKLQCGRINAEVRVDGLDPRPLKQYQCPVTAAEGLKPTTEALLQQGVLIESDSPCNSPIWPVLKADQKTWHLTVDYWELNRVTPRLAPVVTKYIEIMAAISAGTKSF
ncbi:unnamed protein product [Caretta caretta]